MVRKQLREKSAKSNCRSRLLRIVKKVPISKTEPTPLNPAKLSRYWIIVTILLNSGQRKRLVNKTHVMAKKSLAVLSLLKGKDKQKQIKYSLIAFATCRQVVEQLSTEPSDNQTFKELIKEPEKKKQVCSVLWCSIRTSPEELLNRSKNEIWCCSTKCNVFRYDSLWVLIIVCSFKRAREERSLWSRSSISRGS